MLWDPEGHLPGTQVSRDLAEEDTVLLGMSRKFPEADLILDLNKLMFQGTSPPTPFCSEEVGSEWLRNILH